MQHLVIPLTSVACCIIISRVAHYQASVSGLCDRTLPGPSLGLSVCRSVCLSVRKVYCGKTVEWIQMPFRMVSAVGRGMGVLDGGGDRRRERDSFDGECGASHCNQWGLCDAALPKLLWARLVYNTSTTSQMSFM